jgi:hypothetical protein
VTGRRARASAFRKTTSSFGEVLENTGQGCRLVHTFLMENRIAQPFPWLGSEQTRRPSRTAPRLNKKNPAGCPAGVQPKKEPQRRGNSNTKVLPSVFTESIIRSEECNAPPGAISSARACGRAPGAIPSTSGHSRPEGRPSNKIPSGFSSPFLLGLDEFDRWCGRVLHLDPVRAFRRARPIGFIRAAPRSWPRPRAALWPSRRTAAAR